MTTISGYKDDGDMKKLYYADLQPYAVRETDRYDDYEGHVAFVSPCREIGIDVVRMFSFLSTSMLDDF